MSTHDRASHMLAQIDKELSKYPLIVKAERQTTVPKVYAFLGVIGLYFFLVFFNLAAHFLVNVVGVLVPAYYSVNALMTVQTSDDTQWLTYWVVYGLFSVIESAVSASYWFPFYYLFKLCLMMWMAHPRTRGAQVIFSSIIRPVFNSYFSEKKSPINESPLAGQAAAAADTLKSA